MVELLPPLVSQTIKKQWSVHQALCENTKGMKIIELHLLSERNKKPPL